jgi:hypothetical protein
MIWISPILMLLVFVTMEIHVLRLVDGDAHERCLKNIGRLESELFPDLPSELRWAPWPPRSSVRSRPAIWTVSSHDDVQHVAANYVQMVMPQSAYAAQVQQELLEEEAFLRQEEAIDRLNQVTAEYRLVSAPPGGWPTSDSL